MAWLELLKDVPLSAVVKERLAHEEKLHDETKAKNVELQLQVDELTQEVASLRAELAELKPKGQFIERGGLLWKPSGEGPYCPKCRGTMGRIGPRRRCPVCGIVA